MDGLKGFAAVWLCSLLLPALSVGGAILETHRIIAGVGVILGHNYTCWLKFKGGKGIATTAGVYCALAWPAVLIALAIFILAVLVTRYVSIGSIAAAIVLPLAVWFTKNNLLLDIVTTALGALAIYKHKSNIQRLMAGTESRLGKKAEDAK
jgi:glycerol-3-phosphate acyltransferase PlsY